MKRCVRQRLPTKCHWILNIEIKMKKTAKRHNSNEIDVEMKIKLKNISQCLNKSEYLMCPVRWTNFSQKLFSIVEFLNLFLFLFQFFIFRFFSASVLFRAPYTFTSTAFWIVQCPHCMVIWMVVLNLDSWFSELFFFSLSVCFYFDLFIPSKYYYVGVLIFEWPLRRLNGLKSQ